MGFLLLLNQLVSYITVARYVVDPSFKQINQLLAKQIELVFLTLPEHGREQLPVYETVSDAFKEVTGLEIYSLYQAQYHGLNEATYYNFLSFNDVVPCDYFVCFNDKNILFLPH